MNIIALRRRLVYICAIVALLIPLYFLGNPSVRNLDGSVKQSGGTLAQLRTEYNLGQGDLGEIDPASESMRLATLGLRGVAATILWQKAEYYKKEQYWDRLSATLNQIAVLQPHFIKVWEFQSHNLSYNVSSEFDDYRQRYQWVKRGMDYLIKGGKYNRNRTELPYELGWFFGNKLGIADEKKQFRELYRSDSDFHQDVFEKSGVDLTASDGKGPDMKPDNWLSGRLWYEESYKMVAGGAKPAKSIMQFYRMGPQWLMKYSEAIQSEGVLDEPARYAWRTAGRAWREFGERLILTTFGDTIYLVELAKANQDYKEADEEFQQFCGDVYTKMLEERKATLDPEQLAAYEKDYADRTFEEVLLAERAAMVLAIKPLDVAKKTPEDIRVEALQMAKVLEAKRGKIHHIEIYRNQINYPYWQQRCVAEQEDAALNARIAMYEADQLLEKGELDAALEQYETAWVNWEALFNKHPAMMIDDAADEVLSAIQRYKQLLDEPDLPEDFGLAKFMKFREFYDEQFADIGMMGVIASWPDKYPNRDFLDEMLRKSEDMKELWESKKDAAEADDSSEGEAPAGLTTIEKPSKTDGDEPSKSEKPDAEEPTPKDDSPAADTEQKPPSENSDSTVAAPVESGPTETGPTETGPTESGPTENSKPESAEKPEKPESGEKPESAETGGKTKTDDETGSDEASDSNDS